MTDKVKVIAPIVHLNGTSKPALIDQYMKVYHQLSETLDKACQARPHPRDYYVSNKDGLFREAQAEYEREVVDKLGEVRTYLFNLAIAIHGQ